MRRLYRPFVSRYVALSAHIERYLVDAVGVPPTCIERICNGVDIDRFRPAPAREPLAGAPFDDPELVILGTVGRLQAVKDQLGLVRALARLVGQRAPDADRLRLVIAGDGPLRARLEAEIVAGGIGKQVWLAGERTDIPEVMRGLDLFVLPSLAEGISNTILEAMAGGLPVIATAVGGNPELVVPGETGELVPPSDSPALAAALARYAADASLRKRHGEAGRRRAQTGFSLDGMVDRYASLYQNLVDAARSSRLTA
jgi:sugar transferase (PEP-CTERM/EpsH1 system associated)